MKTVARVGSIVAGTLALTVAQGTAADLSFHFDTVFPNDPVPCGSSPWLDATFQEIGLGTVLLTITAAGDLPDTYFIDGQLQGGLFFNPNPSLEPTDLLFTKVPEFGSFGDAVLTGMDVSKADGGGYFDIKVRFSSHNFSSGASISYHITDVIDVDLSPEDFDYFSASGGGQGQGEISTRVASTQITPAPEPGAGPLFATSLGLLTAWHVRRRGASRN
jgi:hypothetical protein